MAISPGLVFLARLLPAYVLTFIAVYAFLSILARNGLNDLPHWAIITYSLLARPLYVTAYGYYSDFRDARKAASVGAAVIPTVHVKWPDSINTMRKFLANMKDGYPGDLHIEWTAKYGNTYQLLLPFEKRVFTFEPDHIKALLATQFDTFEKGPMFMEQARSMLGTGVFNSDGDMWKFHRTITRPFFIRERISDFEIFGVHADDAVRQAKERLAEGYAIDFQDLVSRFTLDSATQFLFGDNVRSLNAGLAYPASSHKSNPPTFDTHPSNRFVSAFMEGQYQIALRARKGETWPLQELFGDMMSPNREVVDEFVRPLMERALRKKKEGALGEKEGEEGYLIDYLVQQTEDPIVLMDELVNLLVAGRDTTASLLTFSVYMMAEHPHLTQRLREEILSKVGPTNHPTYENIRELKYVRAFLNEVLRLYPPVPINSRTSNRDTILQTKAPGVRDFYVPALTRCTYSVFNMHRRTDLWGPDALEFDPDRFIDERLAKYLTPNPFIFCPFNAGPRICLGQQFAYQESAFFLVRLLQQFSSFSLAQDAQPEDSLPPKSWAGAPGRKGNEKIRPQAHLTLYVKGGLWVRMHEASLS
ncbi:cytochrome P450 monooxygenase pc-3 [Cyathus striatus]|nr:cytochrome P450 monooxygenase pc-3 [Cyathus striatus]